MVHVYAMPLCQSQGSAFRHPFVWCTLAGRPLLRTQTEETGLGMLSKK